MRYPIIERIGSSTLAIVATTTTWLSRNRRVASAMETSPPTVSPSALPAPPVLDPQMIGASFGSATLHLVRPCWHGAGPGGRLPGPARARSHHYAGVAPPMLPATGAFRYGCRMDCFAVSTVVQSSLRIPPVSPESGFQDQYVNDTPLASM